MTITTGDQAPEFDLEETRRARVRLADYRGRSNVLLVFHPFAFTAVCEEEARDLQENLESFRNANTEVVFVSCDRVGAPGVAARARRRVHVRLGLLGTRRRRQGVRRLQRGERRRDPRNLLDRHRRDGDLVAGEAGRHATQGIVAESLGTSSAPGDTARRPRVGRSGARDRLPPRRTRHGRHFERLAEGLVADSTYSRPT